MTNLRTDLDTSAETKKSSTSRNDANWFFVCQVFHTGGVEAGKGFVVSIIAADLLYQGDNERVISRPDLFVSGFLPKQHKGIANQKHDGRLLWPE